MSGICRINGSKGVKLSFVHVQTFYSFKMTYVEWVFACAIMLIIILVLAFFTFKHLLKRRRERVTSSFPLRRRSNSYGLESSRYAIHNQPARPPSSFRTPTYGAYQQNEENQRRMEPFK